MERALTGVVVFVLVQGTVLRDDTRVKRSDDTLPLEALVQNLAQKVSANKAEIEALKAQLAQAKINVAFHAEFSADPVQLGPAQRLVLDHVVTNAGNGYDAASGQFRVPVSGSYMFVVNFMGEIHTYNYVHMMLDGDLVDTSISHADGTWDHVSETLIMHVKAGQHVWLQRGTDQNVTKSIRGGHWTTFSGFLIRADP